MTELTRDGAAAGAGGLVIATIRENVVIHGEPINYIYSDSVEPDRATRWPKRGTPRGFPDPCLCRGRVICECQNTFRYLNLWASACIGWFIEFSFHIM